MLICTRFINLRRDSCNIQVTLIRHLACEKFKERGRKLESNKEGLWNISQTFPFWKVHLAVTYASFRASRARFPIEFFFYHWECYEIILSLSCRWFSSMNVDDNWHQKILQISSRTQLLKYAKIMHLVVSKHFCLASLLELCTYCDTHAHACMHICVHVCNIHTMVEAI